MEGGERTADCTDGYSINSIRFLKYKKRDVKSILNKEMDEELIDMFFISNERENKIPNDEDLSTLMNSVVYSLRCYNGYYRDANEEIAFAE